MFHIRRHNRLLGFIVSTYPDEPATRETFLANVQQILLEETTDPPGNKRAVIELMSELNKDMMSVWG
jgi:hypothetical protein